MSASRAPRVFASISASRAVLLFGLGSLASGCSALALDAFEPIDCNVVPHSSRCQFDVWPNPGSRANSDRWLAENHDGLREIRPRVLVLNFANDWQGDVAIRPAIDARIRALSEGSRYHGYNDPEAPAFINYELAGIIDFTDAEGPLAPTEASSRVPVGDDGRFDLRQLFGDSFRFDDPAGSDDKVGLCTLFEAGEVNEVWLAVVESARQPPLMVERKQRYDAAFGRIPGSFNTENSTAGYALEVECGVTVRLAHLNPARGSGCDLQVRGWSIVDTGLSIPYFAENAAAFLNADFRERFGVSFGSFSEVCTEGATCVSYPSRNVAEAVDSGTWRLEPFRQGCGTPEFPPNATRRWDWAGAIEVDSRCEHYGLDDGADGDEYEPYSTAELGIYADLLPEDSRFPEDCGGAWQVYWRQSMPGLDNQARDASGGPMKNWWPFMFY